MKFFELSAYDIFKVKLDCNVQLCICSQSGQTRQVFLASYIKKKDFMGMKITVIFRGYMM